MSSAQGSVFSRARTLSADLRHPKKRSAALRRVRRRIRALVPEWARSSRGLPADTIGVAPADRQLGATERDLAAAQRPSSPPQPERPSIDPRWAHAWVNLASKVRGVQTGAD